MQCYYGNKLKNRTIETNTEVNIYNDITTYADENCSAASNNNNCGNIKQDTHQIPDEVMHPKDLLRNMFIKNYKETLDKELQDRLIHTQLSKKTGKSIIIAANDIVKDILETIENPNSWELNCLVYVTAIACKEYNNDIQRIEPEKAKEKPDMPKWIYHLEELISQVR